MGEHNASIHKVLSSIFKEKFQPNSKWFRIPHLKLKGKWKKRASNPLKAHKISK